MKTFTNLKKEARRVGRTNGHAISTFGTGNYFAIAYCQKCGANVDVNYYPEQRIEGDAVVNECAKR